ncbi:hypothetical protein T06_830 [Trichinella sp. T6]|nr:hypothetical protein T06_830 [Trichinella sp. T6]
MMPLCIKNDGQQAAAQCLFARYLDCKLATPSAARLLLYSCVQRNVEGCSAVSATLLSF